MERSGRGGGALAVQRKPSKKRRRLARSVLEYLTSDTYMYAPLVDGSFQPPDPPPAAKKVRMPPLPPPGTYYESEIGVVSVVTEKNANGT